VSLRQFPRIVVLALAVPVLLDNDKPDLTRSSQARHTHTQVGPYEQRYGKHSITFWHVESAVAHAKAVTIEVVVWAGVGATFVYGFESQTLKESQCADPSNPADPFKDPDTTHPSTYYALKHLCTAI
jgi:hypothetical protein